MPSSSSRNNNTNVFLLAGIVASTVMLLLWRMNTCVGTAVSSETVPPPKADDGIIRRPLGVKALKTRDELGQLLEEKQFQVGVEVGVQRGLNSKNILSGWTSCTEYHLVDLWAQQENYIDTANKNNQEQRRIMEECQQNLAPWQSKTHYHKMLSTEAAKTFANHTFDFVYLDARHDYCGVTEDMVSYWPLLRPGGIMAGHDYVTAAEQTRANPKDHWETCLDGTTHPGAVRGAVEDFALQKGLVISVCYDERKIWRTWLVQKPW